LNVVIYKWQYKNEGNQKHEEENEEPTGKQKSQILFLALIVRP